MIEFKKSYNFFKTAKKIIPLASQTFSKSYLFFDKKYSPLFCLSGKGQFIKDIDGNKFLDLINGLGSVSIGYSIKEIDNKVIKKINTGITYSLSHKLEYEVSKLILKQFPNSDMVRFGKNGSDVNSAAIRLARYCTKRDKVAVCGYHGWHDWYISATTMNGGIPKKVSQDIKFFNYNDFNKLNTIFKKNKLAAVIIEPISYEIPQVKFLKKIRSLCNKHKTILIFDEICSGFRVGYGGAQKLLNIYPDLTTLGKGMANGYPISALIGKKKYMEKVNKIFFSGTFLGETLSLEACKSTILFQNYKKTIHQNIKKGKKIFFSLKSSIKKNNLEKYLDITGHYSWLFLRYLSKKNVENYLIKTFIFQELIKNKILFLGSFNINYSHNGKNIKFIIKTFDNIFNNIRKIGIKNLNKFIYIKQSKNLMKIRKN